jgi:Prenyltransferase and squalene oxidase repeat
MIIEKSITFVQAKGSGIENARLQCILNDTPPSAEISQGLFALQNMDGGFPFVMQAGNLSTINETTVALWWLEELKLLSTPVAELAIDYLLAIQQADGSWEEDPRLAQYELPPWIKLGDPATRMYLTAYTAYWLAVAGSSSLPAFRKSLHFLIRNQDDNGKFLGYLHTTWIATGVFLMAGKRYSSIATQGLGALSSRPLVDWEDSQIAWAVDCLSRAGLPCSHPFVEACLNQLFVRQKEDGSWASEDGEVAAVGATIQTLKVMKRYGLITTDLQGKVVG